MQLNVEKLQCFNAFIVLFTLAVKTINGVSCPTDCICRVGSVKCNPGQTAWPSGLDPTTTVLSLSGLPSKHNTLHHFQRSNVQSVTQLITLIVTYSEVNTIDDGAFAVLNKLHELSIADNNLRSLNSSVFRGLPKLRTLDISGNHYCQFDKTLFTHIKSIEELNLGDMKISKLSPDIFSYLNNLRVLKLYSNHLKKLNASVLGPLTSLTTLDLNENLFRDLPKTLRPKLNSLTALHLSNNPWSCHCQLYWFHDLKPEFLVSGRDGGEVVCNGPARVKYHAFINVPAKDFRCKPPKVLNCDSQLFRIDVHHHLSINCEFEGNPIPKVKWTSPSGVSFIEAGTRSGKYSILDNGTLVINGLGKTDDGKWTFEVYNGTASDNVTVTVEVTGITTTTLSTPSTSTSTSTKKTTSSSSVGAIAGGVTAAVLVIMVILASVLILKYLRRKGVINKRKSKSSQPEREAPDYYNMSTKEKGKEVITTESTRCLETPNNEDSSQSRGNSWAYDNIGASVHPDLDFRNEESTYEGLKPNTTTEQTYSSLKHGEQTDSEAKDLDYTNLKLN